MHLDLFQLRLIRSEQQINALGMLVFSTGRQNCPQCFWSVSVQPATCGKERQPGWRNGLFKSLPALQTRSGQEEEKDPCCRCIALEHTRTSIPASITFHALRARRDLENTRGERGQSLGPVVQVPGQSLPCPSPEPHCGPEASCSHPARASQHPARFPGVPCSFWPYSVLSD